MKKLLIIAAIALMAAVTVQAQEDEGNRFWLGGEVTFSTNNSYTIGPSAGMMFTDNLGAGLTLVLWQAGGLNGWALEPYARMYKGVTDNFKFYGDAYLLMSGNDAGTDFGIGVRPGVQYWFTPDWSMASTLGNVGYNSGAGGVFELSVNFGMHFAFFYHF